MTENDRYNRQRPSGDRRHNIDFSDDYRDDKYSDDDYRDDAYSDDDYRDNDYRDGGYAGRSYDDRDYDNRGYDDRDYDDRDYDDRRRRPDHYSGGYREGYRDAVYDSARSRDDYRHPSPDDNDHDMNGNKPKNFFRRHPVLTNLLLACAATILAVYIALWFLDFWTFHGQERAVPDVKGQSYEMAQGNISRAGLRAVVTDSIYDSYARPGTVVEQSPIPLAKIKKGGTVYLTLVAFTPKMVAIPDFYDVSERQARSMLEGLGITQIMTVHVPSEYAGLVLGARFNGVSLRPGAKVPVSAVITLEVGEGMEEYGDSDASLVDSVAIEQTIEALNID